MGQLGQAFHVFNYSFQADAAVPEPKAGAEHHWNRHLLLDRASPTKQLLKAIAKILVVETLSLMHSMYKYTPLSCDPMGSPAQKEERLSNYAMAKRHAVTERNVPYNITT